MTLPNGAAGIVADIEWAVQYGDGSLQGLVGRTQAEITALKTAEILAMESWQNATAAVWEGLERGVPLVLAIIQAVAQNLFNDFTSYPTVAEALAALGGWWGPALALAGASSPSQFVEQLKGLVPAALANADGTLQGLGSGFVDNLDGTFSYFEAETDVTHLIQQADGTIVSAAQVAHQVATAAGAAGAGVGQAVAAGQQMADHTIAALGATAVQTGQSAAQAGAALSSAVTSWVNNLLGTSHAQASADDFAAAQALAAAQAAVQAAQTAAINAQLPHFYGGSGTSGTNISQAMTPGTLPAGFTPITTHARASAICLNSSRNSVLRCVVNVKGALPQ